MIKTRIFLGLILLFNVAGLSAWAKDNTQLLNPHEISINSENKTVYIKSHGKLLKKVDFLTPEGAAYVAEAMMKTMEQAKVHGFFVSYEPKLISAEIFKMSQTLLPPKSETGNKNKDAEIATLKQLLGACYLDLANAKNPGATDRAIEKGALPTVPAQDSLNDPATKGADSAK